MKKWAGKYVIGLTGNIGTGKSVVRRMLEHLGAYGIDADALSHRAIAKGARATNLCCKPLAVISSARMNRSTARNWAALCFRP